MKRMLSMLDVCRRTGLTARALRFYEQRGLLTAERTQAGRRCYTATQLERLHRIVVLKRAGFPLERIAELLASNRAPLAALVDAQLEALRRQRESLDAALAGLRAARERLDHGGSLDIEALCELIRCGDSTMNPADWTTLIDRYYTPEEQAHWRDRMAAAPAGFDQEGYGRRWAELGARIEAALPLDPAGAQARAFVAEWRELLQPFDAVADERMRVGAARLWSDMANWEGAVRAPFSSRVIEFMKAASAAARSG